MTRSPAVANVALVGYESGDVACLTGIFECAACLLGPDCKWKIQRSLSVKSAVASLRHGEIPIVLCDRDQSPEAWKELLQQIAGMPQPPLLIVTSRLADEQLWAEALNLGAYDVLAKPFAKEEVVRSANLAYMQWQRRHSTPSRPAVLNAVA